MTPYNKRVTAFTKRMAEDMQLRKLSPRTIDAYTYHFDRFALRFGKHPEELGPEQVREFQLWMINELKASWSQFNQAVCALRFFYSFTCKRDWVVQQVPYGPRPQNPSRRSLRRRSRSDDCMRPQYQTQDCSPDPLFRWAENLRRTQPETSRYRLAAHDAQGQPGQGSKDRYVPISPRLLVALRDYWRQTRPSDYLFPGKTDDIPLNKAVVQKVCTLAAAQAKIHKHVTPHTMRHSYATGLLEAGVDLMAISRLLGHSSFTTTMIYLHCRRQHLDSSPSPIDWLPVRQCPKWIDPTLRNSDQDQSQDNNPGEE